MITTKFIKPSFFYLKLVILFLFKQALSFEPRYYYNIKKRFEKGKQTLKNSANFLALATRFTPDWFVISDSENYNVTNQILITPKWGIRRLIGKHFNYELGLGLGIRSLLGKKIGYNNQSNDFVGEAHIRIGYTF